MMNHKKTFHLNYFVPFLIKDANAAHLPHYQIRGVEQALAGASAAFILIKAGRPNT